MSAPGPGKPGQHLMYSNGSSEGWSWVDADRQVPVIRGDQQIKITLIDAQGRPVSPTDARYHIAGPNHTIAPISPTDARKARPVPPVTPPTVGGAAPIYDNGREGPIAMYDPSWPGVIRIPVPPASAVLGSYRKVITGVMLYDQALVAIGTSLFGIPREFGPAGGMLEVRTVSATGGVAAGVLATNGPSPAGSTPDERAVLDARARRTASRAQRGHVPRTEGPRALPPGSDRE